MSETDKDKAEEAPIEAEAVEDAVVVEEIAEVEAEEPGEGSSEDTSAEVAVDPSEMQEPPRTRSPIIPMVLGGVVAGAIGFGAATYLNLGGGQDTQIADLTSRIDAQSLQLEAMTAELSRVEGMTDLSGLRAEVSSIAANVDSRITSASEDLSGQLTGLVATVSALEARVLDLEKRPMAETLPEGATEAYEAEMAALRDAIAQHREDIEAMAAEARAAEAVARQEAVRSEGAAWVTDISIAVNEGAPFDVPLAALEAEGVDVPSVLAYSARDGIASQSELVDAFPDAARSALTAVRSEASEESGGLLTFLQNQVGARSVAPREGDSADAILSRAEAAARAGELTVAIAEVETLPEAGQAAMSHWVFQAQERVAVLAAIDALRETVLNK